MTTTDALEAAVDSLLMPETPEEIAEVDEPQAEEIAGEEVTDDAEASDEDTSETDEANDETPDENAPDTFTVKIDGKEETVTLDELKRGYSGQAKIQRGLQEAAEARKQAEAFASTVQQQQAAVIAFAQELQTQGLAPLPQPPNPELVKTDPFGYVEAKARYDHDIMVYQQQQAQIQAFHAQQSQAEQARRTETLQAQAQMLKERIPDFADAAKASELQKKLWNFGKETYGLSDDELSNITDARVVLALHDAMKYRELKRGTAPVKKAEPPRNVKPSAKRPEPQQLARARDLEKARKSGRPEAFIDLLLQR